MGKPPADTTGRSAMEERTTGPSGVETTTEVGGGGGRCDGGEDGLRASPLASFRTCRLEGGEKGDKSKSGNSNHGNSKSGKSNLERLLCFYSLLMKSLAAFVGFGLM